MPYTVLKSWGKEIWYWNSDRYCYKHLVFNRDMGCSFHYHMKKDEIFHVLKRAVTIRYAWGDDIGQAQEKLLYEGDVFHVPTMMRHKITADCMTSAVLVEVSTTHSEDDSYRI